MWRWSSPIQLQGRQADVEARACCKHLRARDGTAVVLVDGFEELLQRVHTVAIPATIMTHQHSLLCEVSGHQHREKGRAKRVLSQCAALVVDHVP